MKLVITVFICILSTISVHSQVLKFKAKEFAITAIGKTEIKPRDWQETNVLVVVNLNEDNIHIYSKEDRFYDIVGYGKTDTTKNCKAYNYSCIGKEGETCLVSIIMWNEDVENRFKISLNVESPKVSFAYNMIAETVK